jgi:glucose-6-phosphate 1-epimerase
MSITETTFGQLPAVLLRAPDGAEAIVTLYGAHLVSWKGSDGRQRLFCSAASVLDGSKAIRGGVPVIFPQFAEQGAGMRHGFARVSDSTAAWKTAKPLPSSRWPKKI